VKIAQLLAGLFSFHRVFLFLLFSWIGGHGRRPDMALRESWPAETETRYHWEEDIHSRAIFFSDRGILKARLTPGFFSSLPDQWNAHRTWGIAQGHLFHINPTLR
jgi:hypothetical protein